MKFLRLFLPAAALLFAAACASDPACAIKDNGDGTRNIECPGQPPVRVVAAGEGNTCTLGVGDDGGKVISCSDGTVVRITPEGHVVFPGTGTIEGRAMLFGQSDHSGIRIYVEDSEFETTTDADGNYVLGPLPAGIHVVVFEATGRISERRENIPVINGAWKLETIELRFGWKILAGATTIDGNVEPSPDGSAVLAFTIVPGLGGWLSLWELETGDEIPLGGIVSTFMWSPDGKRALFQERVGLDGPLQLWDREAGVQVQVAERSVRGGIGPDSKLVVYETLDDDNQCSLHAWRRESGVATRVGACMAGFTGDDGLGEQWRSPWPFNRDGTRFIYMDATPQLMVYDAVRNTSHPISSSFFSTLHVRFLPDGRHVLVLEWRPDFSALDLVIVDAETGERHTVASDTTDQYLVAPDGETIVAWRNLSTETPNLLAYRVDDESSLVIQSGFLASRFAFSADGARLLWIEAQGNQAGPLHVLEIQSPENTATYTARAASRGEFASVGSSVLVTDGNGEIHVWDPITGAAELVETVPTRVQFSPDGRRVVVIGNGSEIQIVDFASGETFRHSDDNLGGPPFAWRPDGSALVYGRFNDDSGSDAMLWEPPAAPVKIGTGSFSTSFFSAAGSLAFLECRLPCTGGYTLVLWHVERDAREPIDVPVSDIRLKHGVLWYPVVQPGGDENGRNGVYAVQLP